MALLLLITSIGSATPVEVAAADDYPTVDDRFEGTGPIGPGVSLDITVTGRGGVPASGVGAVALNVTVTNPTAASFLTVWPTGTTRPTSSNLNFTAGQTTPNMVIAKVGADGKVSIYNLSGSADVVVDVLGWFPESGGYTGLIPARLLDSRGPRSQKTCRQGYLLDCDGDYTWSMNPTHFQAVYAVLKGVTPVAGRQAAIASEVAQAQEWFVAQAGGLRPEVAMTGSDISVITVNLPFTQADIFELGKPTPTCMGACYFDDIEAAVKDAYPSVSKVPIILYLEGATGGGCAYASRRVITMEVGQNGVVSCTHVAPDVNRTGLDFHTKTLVHEMLHSMGAVANCAPNYVPGNHSRDPLDIMNAAGSGAQLDPGNDDYFNHENAGCLDVADSSIMRKVA